jgi:hypothetical protein
MFDPIRPADHAPDFSGTDCKTLTETDQEHLWEAAKRFVAAQGLAVRLTARLSRNVIGFAGHLDDAGHRVFGAAWDGVETRVQAAVEEVLWRMHDLATIGIGSRGNRGAPTKLHRLSASASGAISGFAGLPGLLLDIPVTTALMLRTIAGIARQYGEDIEAGDGKRACLEVLAQSGPRTEAEDAEAGYWSARAGLSHLTVAALIRTAAARFGVTLSEKILAQAVPVAGAVAGAGLNWIFMGYYQELAHVHFTIRAVERRAADPASIRDCFNRLVEQARTLKTTRAGRGSRAAANGAIAAGVEPKAQSPGGE